MAVTAGPVLLSFRAGYVCGISASIAWLIRTAGLGTKRDVRRSFAYAAWAILEMFNIFAISVGVVAVITFTRYHGSIGGTVSLAKVHYTVSAPAQQVTNQTGATMLNDTVGSSVELLARPTDR